MLSKVTQFRLALHQFRGAFLDLLFQTFRRLGALGQQRIAFDCVLAKHFDGLPHCCDLVVAANWNWRVPAAAGDREHRTVQQV